ncbi:hypothetical protein [Sphingobium lignivorans]|uniref:Uncharacterized protein YjbJ (UPF0337 family) n=1 Tax=Sphingobium lignivorans TaxID=2735886 RepID=A0ABR6NAI9_9SPHN|nr:hypothetical protein [Sphingobium lignivorans]MBB5984303.1 uncharacterized protein YjbJ (UPF0337 family) [Sphingobium lignivorans]
MSESKEDRQQRLARALRNNLRRRKGQARERAGGLTGGPEQPAPGDNDPVN